MFFKYLDIATKDLRAENRMTDTELESLWEELERLKQSVAKSATMSGSVEIFEGLSREQEVLIEVLNSHFPNLSSELGRMHR